MKKEEILKLIQISGQIEQLIKEELKNRPSWSEECRCDKRDRGINLIFYNSPYPAEVHLVCISCGGFIDE